MLEIKDIVNVIINREVVSKTVRDLQTIAVLTGENRYTGYRKFTSVTAMLSDGFEATDKAYIAAQRIFSQNPQVKEIVVGQFDSEESPSYVTAIQDLQSQTNEWFFLVTDATTDVDKLAIATYVETQDIIYVFSDTNSATVTNVTTDIFSKLKALGFVKSFGIHFKDTAVVMGEAAWVGRFASAVIGSNLWLYKTLVGLVAEGYSKTEVDYLRSKEAHFYTKVGQDSVVVGNGNVPSGEKIHVILGAIWLKIRIGERLWNLLYIKERILYTNGGIDLFKAELVTVLNEAVTNNILTDDDGGFQISVPDANKLTSQERASGVLSRLTFRARLAGAIIYVDAVEGTVYA